ncbi:hypothetical protein POVWA2_015390 [Plasmodium ovale wallikeri]|uniref:Uncharacterized protein n=1 Tax=Plasmodium ovale wallikeri TaxID=864142 RepID=A0A1A8YPM8_PLAOA|nr:hypothetical protein POVWA1_015890 [Plasmodium ovale wallikeri]SBT33562.1 hypothetical protein POVWA2_015390 [Plasmodium ovale wallikeri]
MFLVMQAKDYPNHIQALLNYLLLRQHWVILFRYWLNNFTRKIKKTTYNNNEASEELYGSSSSSSLPLGNSNIHMAYHFRRR